MRGFPFAILCSVLATGVAPAQTNPSFYTATKQELAADNPGAILRKETLPGPVPSGASAYRILYRSTGLHGEPIAVSAVLVIPPGAPPAEGRPIVAWQHPTSGVDQPCAPSLSPSVLQMIQGLPRMLERGYVVVATDYAGLGTAGPHPYLVGESEGRAVLDAVRAAHSLPEAHAGERFVLWGHSQGARLAERRNPGTHLRAGTAPARHRRRRSGHGPLHDVEGAWRYARQPAHGSYAALVLVPRLQHAA